MLVVRSLSRRPDEPNTHTIDQIDEGIFTLPSVPLQFANRLNSEEPQSVNATALLRFPPFWKNNPLMWLHQVEMAFSLSRITAEDTKYQYVILNLDNEVLPFVSDIVTAPPSHNKYQTLKNRILELFDESQIPANATLISRKSTRR